MWPGLTITPACLAVKYNANASVFSYKARHRILHSNEHTLKEQHCLDSLPVFREQTCPPKGTHTDIHNDATTCDIKDDSLPVFYPFQPQSKPNTWSMLSYSSFQASAIWNSRANKPQVLDASPYSLLCNIPATFYPSLTYNETPSTFLQNPRACPPATDDQPTS